MTTTTPLEKLGDAINAFFHDTGMPAGTVVTGWVVSASTARLQFDDTDALPIVDSHSFAIGPETSWALAKGLAGSLDVVCQRAIWHGLDSLESPDGE